MLRRMSLENHMTAQPACNMVPGAANPGSLKGIAGMVGCGDDVRTIESAHRRALFEPTSAAT
jgi:hypothetical protein